MITNAVRAANFPGELDGVLKADCPFTCITDNSEKATDVRDGSYLGGRDVVSGCLPLFRDG